MHRSVLANFLIKTHQLFSLDGLWQLEDTDPEALGPLRDSIAVSRALSPGADPTLVLQCLLLESRFMSWPWLRAEFARVNALRRPLAAATQQTQHPRTATATPGPRVVPTISTRVAHVCTTCLARWPGGKFDPEADQNDERCMGQYGHIAVSFNRDSLRRAGLDSQEAARINQVEIEPIARTQRNRHFRFAPWCCYPHRLPDPRLVQPERK